MRSILIAVLLLATAPAPAQDEGPLELKVATKSFPPFVLETGDGWEGFSIDLWEAIAGRIGAKTEWVGKRTVGELLDAVRDGEVQVAIAGITINSEREQTVDFSHSIFESGLQILVSHRHETGGLDVFRALFSRDMLQLVGLGFLCLFVVANALWLVERKRNAQFPASYGKGIWEAFWWAGVTISTVGYGDRYPVGCFGRVVALLWMVTGIVLISFFTATVTTLMTVQSIEGSIQGTEDLPGKRVGTARGTTAAAWLEGARVGREEFETIDGALAALEEGRLDAVVYDYPVLVHHANHAGHGRTRLVGRVFARQNYGIALEQYQSVLKEKINRALLDLRDKGQYDRLREKWFGPGE